LLQKGVGMSSGKHLFKETDVARALRAAKKAGVHDFILRITEDALELRGGQQEAEKPAADVQPLDEWKVA
jgi:hypothetical protein